MILKKKLFIKSYNLLFLSLILAGCQKRSELLPNPILPSPIPSPLPSLPPPSPTPTMTPPVFGACERGTCEDPFCAENCSSPGKCHVKDVDGICRPSCGYAALLAGWGHYGPDCIKGTSDDNHTHRTKSYNGSLVVDCESLEVKYPDDIIRDDWTDIPFYLGVVPHEVIEKGGVCCVRGDPITTHTPCSQITDVKNTFKDVMD